jgi:hypothetical protein
MDALCNQKLATLRNNGEMMNWGDDTAGRPRGPMLGARVVAAKGRLHSMGIRPTALPKAGLRARRHCSFIVVNNGTRAGRTSNDPKLGNCPQSLQTRDREPSRTRPLSGPNAPTHDVSGRARVARERPLTVAAVRRRILAVRGFNGRDDSRDQTGGRCNAPGLLGPR